MLLKILQIFVITLTTLAWGATIQYSSMPNPECQRSKYFPDEECCIMPNFYTEELIEKCGELIDGSSTDMDLSQTFETCFINCVINETKIMDDDGELNEEQMSNYVNEIFADTPDVIPIIEESFRICFYITNLTRQFIQPDDDCPIQIASIMDCLYIRTFMFCPESSWTNTEICNDGRAYSETCLPKFLYMKLK